MENIVSQTMQHRKVLFLISLPRTPEFQDCAEDVKECLDELRQLHVDVREHIRAEDLAEANKFDVVIVVAHRDTSTEELVLADANMSISDFVSSIPTDFKGVIDFSSCYSATAFAAIKERCPQCKAQVALVETTLLRRLIIYPTLVECLYENPTVDYGVAYKEVSKAFDDAVEEIERKDVSMVHLGDRRTSVYAPYEVRRKSHVPIHVFIHYDAERQEVKSKAARNTEVHINSEDLGNVGLGESLTLILSFIQGYDGQHLHIIGEDRKYVTVTEEIIHEFFIVGIDDEFSAPNFGCYVSVLKDGKEPPIRKYPVIINVIEEAPQTDAMRHFDDIAISDEELVNKLSPFFNSQEISEDKRKVRIRKFINELEALKRQNSKAKPIISYIANCIKNGWIAPHVFHERGKLYNILKGAGLFNATLQYWNAELKDAF